MIDYDDFSIWDFIVFILSFPIFVVIIGFSNLKDNLNKFISKKNSGEK
jgi:hypothetical protein